MNVHFHTLVFDGVFSRTPMGGLTFDPAFGPTDAEVAQVLDAIRQRVQRLLRRRGLEPGNENIGPEDPLAEASLALAGIVGASVQGRVALGTRAGARVRRLGHGPTAESDARGPRHAYVDGFDLHANVWVGAHDRARREQLCRYLLGPPLADDRLRLLGDGRVRVQLKRAWSDGTTHLLFEPVEFLEKLAALAPRRRSTWSSTMASLRRTRAGGLRWSPTVAPRVMGRRVRRRPHDERRGAAKPRYWSWAALMRRAFDLDVLRCPCFADRMELLTTIDDPAVTHRILAHLGLPGGRDDPERAPLCLLRKRTSPCSPSLSRSDVAGPPARAIVCPYPASRHGVQGPRPASRCCLTTPTDSGRIALRRQGALSAPYQAEKETGGD